MQGISDALAGVAAVFVASFAGGEEAVPDPGLTPADRVCEAETVCRLRRALVELPEIERRLLELYYFGEKNLEEAGLELGLSKSWASRRHARAIDLLRAKLEADRSEPIRARRR
jgi:RNA polymerase sigma factor for flagellar operon FliA